MIGTPLVEAGAGAGGGWGREGGKEDGGGDGRWHVSCCVEQRKQWEDPWATQLDGENELSQTDRGIRVVSVGFLPRVRSKLSCALHAHRRKKLQKLDNMAMKRAMIKFRGAREKVSTALLECLGSRKKTR